MRQIKFRGKSLDKGEWVCGDLIGTMTACPAITITSGICGTWFIDPDTIGQFTGMTDRNGKEIYEGDILQVCINAAMTRERGITAEVYWDDKSGIWAIRKTEAHDEPLSFAMDGGCAVIGNIYDNPELLEGGSEE